MVQIRCNVCLCARMNETFSIGGKKKEEKTTMKIAKKNNQIK